MNGDWVEMLVRLLVAVALAAAIGCEREARGKAAGVRTHILISIGAAGFTLASLYGFGGADISRVASGVVAGVGFIGAGVIFRGGHGEGVAGLTTAASIWVTAAVGLCAACGLYLLALALSAVSVLVLELPKARD